MKSPDEVSNLIVKPCYRWLMPCCIGMVMFCNHYVRDSVGALEKELEATLFSAQQYTLLNGIYFLPNVLTPVIIGVFTEKLGGPSICFLYSAIIAAGGDIIFGLGVHLNSVPLSALGRLLTGSMYEVLDALMPITYLSPYFDREWGKVVGIMNVLLRLGSVCNFVATPIIFTKYGLEASIWASTCVGGGCILFVIISRAVEQQWISENARASEVQCAQSNYEEIMSPTSSSEHIEECADDCSDGLLNEGATFSTLSSSRSPTEVTSADGDGADGADEDFSTRIKELFVSVSFCCYLMVGACVYGSMVPFWFMGSKYMQEYYGLDMVQADDLMVIPEGMIVLVCLPLGMLVDNFRLSFRAKLCIVALATLLMAVAYGLLVSYRTVPLNSQGGGRAMHNTTSSTTSTMKSSALFYSTSHRRASALVKWEDFRMDRYFDNSEALFVPMGIVCLLGFGFACAVTLFWGAVVEVVDPSLLPVASGVVSCAVNVLPAVVPPALALSFGGDGVATVLAMAVMAMLASAAAAAAALCHDPEARLRAFMRGLPSADDAGDGLGSYAKVPRVSQSGSNLESSADVDVDVDIEDVGLLADEVQMSYIEPAKK